MWAQITSGKPHEQIAITNVGDGIVARRDMPLTAVSHNALAEIMHEMAPLLLEEGIDLDNLDINDLEHVNAALARATEHRNLELFTPVGEQRAMALTVHRLIAEALAEGAVDLAHAV